MHPNSRYGFEYAEMLWRGKGGRKRVDDAPFMPDRVGVLKHAVPHWLATHPLEGTVVGVYPAHQSHGGDGALYVYLKKPG